MFKFLKKKIKGAVKNISQEVEEKAQEEIVEMIKEEKVEPDTIIEKETKEKIQAIIEKEPKQSLASKLKEKVTTKKISEKEFENLFWELELALLENNVAVEAIEKIKESLKVDLVNVPLNKNNIEQIIGDTLKDAIKELFKDSNFDLVDKIKESEKPYVILLLGVNGSGKTTTTAKLTKLLQSNDLKIALSASDTFRAAAIDQLQIWADKLDVKLIKHDYGSDAAAVAFDAIQHAKAKKVDVVLIDTAGRMHSNINLRDELKKIVRIAKPDLKIFVGESITGNDCIEQATTFNKSVGIDGIILSKADVDEKGGTAISISHVTDKPILYLGTGQELKDIEKFNLDKLIQSLGW